MEMAEKMDAHNGVQNMFKENVKHLDYKIHQELFTIRQETKL